MALYLIIFSVIVITCVFLNKFSGKVGIPVLLFFLMLGLLCGSRYDEFAMEAGWIVGDISTIALIFIMFYGGFGTRWKSARPIVVEAGLLATVGVVLTAVFVGLFCHFVLGNDIFSIVFCIVLISIALQGSLIPLVARRTSMTDTGSDVMTTFSDFSENAEVSFGDICIKESSKWNNRQIKELGLPQDCLVALVIRGSEHIVPDGNTVLENGDVLVLLKRNSANFVRQTEETYDKRSIPQSDN